MMTRAKSTWRFHEATAGSHLAVRHVRAGPGRSEAPARSVRPQLGTAAEGVAPVRPLGRPPRIRRPPRLRHARRPGAATGAAEENARPAAGHRSLEIA